MSRSGGEPEERWTGIDRYVTDLLLGADPALDAALEASAAAGLPDIQVSAPYGKMLHLLARAARARRILEIGTLGGYSAIWLARALPADGRLVTCELDPRHAEVARGNLERAGLGDRVEVHVGPALETLRGLASEGAEPFDMVFIDADKPGYPDYLELSLQLSRAGTVIVADNVIRRGDILDGSSGDPNVQAMRRFHERLASEKRISATAVQTVGGKGYDGFVLAVVTE
ncbi:MAG: methyltransferase [Chloroflexi bacterium RIFCSPLOWO2_12_FULL_71_12]|nr:MAG: methyltransferase [Chloroflexi bacterium RIFCSPLOWO2_12_FULL_71_12]